MRAESRNVAAESRTSSTSRCTILRMSIRARVTVVPVQSDGRLRVNSSAFQAAGEAEPRTNIPERILPTHEDAGATVAIAGSSRAQISWMVKNVFRLSVAFGLRRSAAVSVSIRDSSRSPARLGRDARNGFTAGIPYIGLKVRRDVGRSESKKNSFVFGGFLNPRDQLVHRQRLDGDLSPALPRSLLMTWAMFSRAVFPRAVSRRTSN